MIYNFVELLRSQFPAEVIYPNSRENVPPAEEIPDRNVLVKQSGGPTKWPLKYTRATVQIITRDIDTPGAEQLSWDIYHFLHGRPGLIIPAALNVKGRNYPALQTASIEAVQMPMNIGVDDAGRTEFSTNYIVTYVET